MARLVVSLQWCSEYGLVNYRKVYDDGSKGPLVWTSIETNDPRLKIMQGMIERQMID